MGKNSHAKVNTFCEIEESSNFGRYLIASQDIAERTPILIEFPVIHAPADEFCDVAGEDPEEKKSIIFCLDCCSRIKPLDHKTDHPETCQACGWPVCNLCSKTKHEDGPHKENECKLFQINGVKFPPPHAWPVLYKSILILRILLLIQERNPSIWNAFFLHLEHHNDIRKKKEHCIKTDKMILENIAYFCAHSTVELNEELIQRIIGTVNVNGFASAKGQDGCDNLRKMKSLFQNASLFAHSCAPNCTWNIHLVSNSQHNYYTPQIKVCTSIPVKEGELLTIPYNTRHLFYGTLKRQILIESVAHFICKCKRCLDPTELGTFMSSIRCFQCELGFLVSKDPENQDSDWMCSREMCGGVENVSKVVYFVTDVEEYIDKIQNANLERNKEILLLQKLFLKHCDKLLHKNHYTLQEISTRILELLVESLEEASLAQIELFLHHCDYLKGIADVIIPGSNGYQDQLRDYNAAGIYHQQQIKTAQT